MPFYLFILAFFFWSFCPCGRNLVTFLKKPVTVGKSYLLHNLTIDSLFLGGMYFFILWWTLFLIFFWLICVSWFSIINSDCFYKKKNVFMFNIHVRLSWIPAKSSYFDSKMGEVEYVIIWLSLFWPLPATAAIFLLH